MTYGLSDAVAGVLEKPPADGILLYRLVPAALSAGFEPGDLLVSLDGRPTSTEPAYDAAFRVKSTGPVPNVVVRGGKKVTIAAERRVAKACSWIAVKKNAAVEPRPEPNARLSKVLPAGGASVDIAAKRVTTGLAKKGRAAVKGKERHAIDWDCKTLTVSSNVDFEEFGRHHYDVTSQLTFGKGATMRAAYTDHPRKVTVDGSVRFLPRRSTLSLERGEESAEVAIPADAVPSIAMWLLAALLPREPGLTIGVSPIPEDGYPFLPPPGSGSFYPVDPVGLPRSIVCSGEEQLKLGRSSTTAWRYDTVALEKVRSTTWIDEDGQILFIDRVQSLLDPS